MDIYKRPTGIGDWIINGLVIYMMYRFIFKPILKFYSRSIREDFAVTSNATHPSVVCHHGPDRVVLEYDINETLKLNVVALEKLLFHPLALQVSLRSVLEEWGFTNVGWQDYRIAFRPDHRQPPTGLPPPTQ